MMLWFIVMLNIITNPNPILRKKSQQVADLNSPEIQQLIPEMVETMLTADGVGLAAPQIGKNIRLVTIHFEGETYVMVNPLIVQKSFFKEWGEEGCLSVPGVAGQVKRPRAIKLHFVDENGKRRTLSAKKMLARIIQHEIDHLDGILFIDKAKKLKQILTHG